MKRRTPQKLLVFLLIMLLVIPGAARALAAEDRTITLHSPDAYRNEAFAVENMFPGDAETKDFTVKVSHKKPITLYFVADIHPDSEKLSEVLMVTVRLPEKDVTLYDGLMRDMPSALAHELAADEIQVLYRITAYMDTSAGNDYQYQSLRADFLWWYTEEAEQAQPTAPGGADAPQTGDEANLGLYVVLLGNSLAGLLLLLLLKKRKKEAAA